MGGFGGGFEFTWAMWLLRAGAERRPTRGAAQHPRSNPFYTVDGCTALPSRAPAA